MAENVIKKLNEMLADAKSGKLTHLAYHCDRDGSDTWGLLNVSERGQLVIPARLSALAIQIEDDKEA